MKHVLLGVLIGQFVLPAPGFQTNAAANPPENAAPVFPASRPHTNGVLVPQPTMPGTITAAERDEVVQAAARRNQAIGLDPEQVILDPYFVDRRVQRVEVHVYRVTDAGREPEGDEERIVETIPGATPDAAATQVTYRRTKTEIFYPGELNQGYHAPGSYSLADDVKVTFTAKELTFELRRKRGSEVRVYQRIFSVPGVQSVSTDALSAHVLFANGNFATLMMSHLKLFEANEMAGGGPVMIAQTSALSRALTGENGRIPADIRIESFDATKRDRMDFPNEIPEEMRKALRHGDIVVYRPRGERMEILDLVPLHGICEALSGHVSLLELRQRLLTAENPMAELLQGIEDTGEAVRGRPELFPHGNNLSALLTASSQENLSPAVRRRAGTWAVNPWELTGLTSRSLGGMRQFVDAMNRFSRNSAARSTFPHTPNDPYPAGTMELAMEQEMTGMLATGPDAMPSVSPVNGTNLNFIRRHGKSFLKYGGLLASTLAALSAFIYMMPNSPFALETRLFNLDIPALGVHLAGPSMPYIYKFWLVCAGMGITFFYLLPIAGAYLSERILGRTVPRGWRAGLQTTLFNGWRVFCTVGLNSAALMLRSWRESFASLLAGIPALLRRVPGLSIVGHLLRADGLPEMLEGMRYGQSPGQFLMPPGERRSVWGTMMGALGQLRGTGDDPSVIQSRQEAIDLGSFHIALFLALEQLGLDHALPADVPLNASGLTRALGKRKYAILEQRVALLAQEVSTEIRARPDRLRSKTPGQLYAELRRNERVQGCLTQLLTPLTRDEIRQAAAHQSRGRLARWWPKIAGSNDIYVKFRYGEASEGNVVNFGQAFSNDIATYGVWMGVTAGDDAYATALRPDRLVASDQGYAFGLVGDIAFMELLCNFFSWVANIPLDELTYGDEALAAIPDTMRNPQRTETSRNVVLTHLRKKGDGFFRSMGRYLSALKPLSADFWHGIERLGDRISIAQLKTWKPTIIAGFVTTFIGFLMIWGELKPEQQSYDVVSDLALRKVLLGNVFAFIGYRIWWMWNSIGMRNMKQEPMHDSSRLNVLIGELTEAAMVARDNGLYGDVREAERKLVAFIEQKGKTVPPEVLRSNHPLERAAALGIWATNELDIATDSNPGAEFVTAQAMTGITTMIGIFGIALAWKFAEHVSWPAVAALTVGLWGFGKVCRWIGGNLRARSAYNLRIAELRASLEALRATDNVANQTRVFNAILAVAESYRRYDKLEFLDEVGLEILSRSSDLLTVGTQLYTKVVANPPTNNMATRWGQWWERRTAFCREAIAAEGTTVASNATSTADDPPRAVNE